MCVLNGVLSVKCHKQFICDIHLLFWSGIVSFKQKDYVKQNQE